jgi:hypothetical protein
LDFGGILGKVRRMSNYFYKLCPTILANPSEYGSISCVRYPPHFHERIPLKRLT